MDININKEFIIKLMQLPSVGRRTAHKILSSRTVSITSDNNLIDLLNEYRENSKLPDYSLETIQLAFDKAEQIIENSEKNNIKLISFLDALYPSRLLQTDDFPLILSYIGDINGLLEKPNISIIGTRNPTDYGFKLGKRLGHLFSESGFNIVSGLAIGCDTAGHMGAIENESTTTAVLAHGLDTIYPKENKKLSEEILEKGGVLISEYFIKQRPIGNFFIERDRIQAGLSDSVFVVETDVKGGTMHTVKYCLDYKRILACLNHPDDFNNEPSTQGNKMLIKNGKAIPVISKIDIEQLITKIHNNESTNHLENITLNTLDRNSNDDFKQLNLWD
jgi:DNA processing protein